MQTLFESEHLSIELDRERRVVFFRRTERSHASLEEAIQMFRDAERATARIDRARHGLLVDLRRAVGRNDPSFEQAIEAPRASLLARFGRSAVLVRTIAGKLQEQRLNRTSSAPTATAVFQDEAEALAHVAGA